MIRLTKQQVLYLHGDLVKETGGSEGLRDEGLLDSALNAPFASFGGADVYPSRQQKAARLCFSITRRSVLIILHIAHRQHCQV